MGEYEFVEKLYSFAKENGYRVEDLNIGDRRNNKGTYKYVTLALIVPGKDYKPFTKSQLETTEQKTTITPDGEKEQVIKNEI